jgi:NADP-dependent 3-hydroxy acid dehydrogenase YdfG
MKAIITGASKGIGAGIATVLAQDGFELGLMARSQELLAQVKGDIASKGGTAFIHACDLRDPRQTEEAISSLVRALGGIDALINNAGVVIRKDIFTLSVDEWRAMLETNVSGLFHATRAVLPYLKSQGRGHIINVSSISGQVPLAGGSGYAASKYAVTGFSESLFLEVRAHGIKVTTLFPGSVDTQSHRQGLAEEGWKLKPEAVGQACRYVLRSSAETCISRVEIRPLKVGPKR